MLVSTLNFMREMLGLPLEHMEEFYQYKQLRVLSSELRRVASSLSVDPAVSEKASACLDKVNRMLDILCEEDQDDHQDDEEA